MLVSSLIESSLRKIGALSSGETIETTRQAEALSALQVMLRSWGALSANIFATVKESFTLSAGTASYTWGSGGVFATTRPNIIAGAYILDSSDISHPVDIITEQKYRSYPAKSTSSRPYSLFYYPSYPLGVVYLYPVPDAVESIYIDSYKQFTEIGSFSAAGDTLSFPSTHEEAIIYNLSIRLAPEYGKTVSAEVATVAKKSYEDLLLLNTINSLESAVISVPAGYPYGSGYSIDSDSYR